MLSAGTFRNHHTLIQAESCARFLWFQTSHCTCTKSCIKITFYHKKLDK